MSRGQALSRAASLVAFASLSAMVGGLPFQTIERGHSSGIEEALTQVFRNEQDFASFWARHGANSYPPPNAPDVDFNSQMAVAVFTGTKNSGGYAVEITSVDEDDEDDGHHNSNKLVVNFMTSDPPPGAMTTMALTQPHHIISLDASDREVVFVGSAKPVQTEETSFPRFILTVEKERKDMVVKLIEANLAVTKVTSLNMPILFVDFDSTKTSKVEARKMLEGVRGVKTVEEDGAGMGGMGGGGGSAF